MLESVIVSDDGRLFFTANDALMRLDRPGGEPRLLTPVIEPGGLAFDARRKPDRRLRELGRQRHDRRHRPAGGAAEGRSRDRRLRGLRDRPLDGERRHQRSRRQLLRHQRLRRQRGPGPQRPDRAWVRQGPVGQRDRRRLLRALPLRRPDPGRRRDPEGRDRRASERHPVRGRRARRPGRRPRRDGDRRPRPALRRRQPRRPDLEGGRQSTGDLRPARRPRPVPRRPERGRDRQHPGPVRRREPLRGHLQRAPARACRCRQGRPEASPDPAHGAPPPHARRRGDPLSLPRDDTRGPRAGRARAGEALERVRIRFAGERARTNRRGRATIEATFDEPGRYRARAKLEGYRSDRATVRVRPRG